jgi:6-phosphogluconolactonase
VAIDTFVYPDEEALAEAACALALGKIQEAIGERNRAIVVLAGGNTPRATYRLLARGIVKKRIPAERLLWLFGDERWVLVDDPQSNEGMARESLLHPIAAPASTVLSWEAGHGDPVGCAQRYGEKAADAMLGQNADLVFLGMGSDGHTASLFPDATMHFSSGRSVAVGPEVPGFAVAVHSLTAKGWRLTLCPDVLNAARTVVFLVAGAEKSQALRRARGGDPATPAAWIRGERTVFMATRDALGKENADFGRDVRHG